MAVRSSSELKALYMNGDKPDEDDFGDLIDTLFDGTIWLSTLVFEIKGSILIDENVPQQTLKFQIDATLSPIFDPVPTWIFQADSSVSQTNWKFWNGTNFIGADPGGFVPAYQNITYPIITYTYPDAGHRGDILYIRYRSGFGFIWSDYAVSEIVLG